MMPVQLFVDVMSETYGVLTSSPLGVEHRHGCRVKQVASVYLYVLQ
jgi:hypothetical protein